MDAEQIQLFAAWMVAGAFWSGVVGYVLAVAVRHVVACFWSAVRRRGARKPFRSRVEAALARHEFAVRVLRARLERGCGRGADGEAT